MTIKEIQEEIVDEFSMFDDWMERYEYLIELGKSIPLIDPQYQTDDNLIKGCQSKVWLHAEEKGGKILFTANSDAILTKGIIALLLRVFSNHSPQEILDADTSFIDKIGLKEHLSPTRANGLVSMIKQLKLYAIGYQSKLKQ
ncbi:MAG TPA: SufE family protein [Flavobacteriia bacterium]|jgi:cysteine desulfuration protein SufE|nr:SufE family protein [Flavobacteriia bacterium]